MSPECSAASACDANPRQITATHPQRTRIIEPLVPGCMESAQQYAFERSQLIRIELADSRSQAKLPMNLAGLLHLFNVNCE
jgi:hypothetical protein